MTVEMLDPRKVPFRKSDKPRANQGNVPYELLVESIKRDGLRTPVFVDQDGCCFCGHYRLLAAVEAGASTVPVVRVSNRHAVDLWFQR